MAVLVEYDKEGSVGLIFTTTSGGTVFSPNRSGSTTFDYFANNCVVNDAIYFATLYGAAFHDLKFYVGTAFAATSVTFVWEYWNGGAWTTLTVTDGTAGFTNLGQNWVTWTQPIDWSDGTVNGFSATYAWVRCRISAINTPTEGGAQSTQVVKGKDSTIQVSGGTSGTPATFTDIYNADVAAGWNVFKRYGADNVCFETLKRIVISDYFTDTAKVVIFADGIMVCHWGVQIYCTANSVVTFGYCGDTARKLTQSGIMFLINENLKAHHWIDGASTSTIYLYSCVAQSRTNNRCSVGSVNRAWQYFGDLAGFRSIRAGVTDIANAIVCASSENIANAPLSVDTCIAVNSIIVGPLPNSLVFVKNCKVRTSGYEITSWAANPLQRGRLVNLDALWNEFSIYWGGSPTGGEIWRDYDLYLKVIGKNNIAISTATDTPGSFGRNWYEITGATALEYKTNVAPRTTSTATRTAGQPWTISIRTNCNVVTTVNKYAFDTYKSGTGRFIIGYQAVSLNGFYKTVFRDIGLFSPGVHNYSIVCDGTNIRCFRDGRFIGHATYADATALDGECKWGSRYSADQADWDYNLEYAVIHDIALSEDQVKTLHEQFEGKKTVQLEDKDGDIQLNCFLSPDGYLNRDFGLATSGTTTTLTDTAKTWNPSTTACPQWTGHDLLITSGTGAGQRTTISSNTANTLTFATLATAPDNTSKYVIIPIITHSKWNYLSGTVPFDTYNDFTLRINKSGYVFRPMKLTIDRKIDDVISLERVLDNNFSKRCRINTQ